MHPHTFYTTLFEPEKRDEVFVIVSFTDEFEPRWRDVIEPCIREDLKLKAVRVDYNESGESIVHDILDGIAHARLVIADITSKPIRSKPEESRHRSANVMWELGLAHVMRLPDEVLVIRSDTDKSIFDLTQFRAFYYDPKDSIEARRELRRLAEDRLRSIDVTRAEQVRRATSLLDVPAMELLFEAASKETITHAIRMPVGMIAPLARVAAISKLLELGAIRMHVQPVPLTDDAVIGVALAAAATYRVTALGRAMCQYVVRGLGLEDVPFRFITPPRDPGPP